MKIITIYDHVGKNQYKQYIITLPDSTKLYCVHSEIGDGLPYKEYVGYCENEPNIHNQYQEDEFLKVLFLGQYVFFRFRGLVKEEIESEDKKEILLPQPLYLQRNLSLDTWSQRVCYRFDGFNRHHLFGVETIITRDGNSNASQCQITNAILPYSKYAYSNLQNGAKEQFVNQFNAILKELNLWTILTLL